MKLQTAEVNFLIADGLGINKGCDWSVVLSIWDKEGSVEEGVDLTGFQGLGTLKLNAGDANPVAPISVEVRENSVVLSMPWSVTKDIPTDGNRYYKGTRYQYDVVLWSSTERYRVLQGFVEVSPCVTDTDDNDYDYDEEVTEDAGV